MEDMDSIFNYIYQERPEELRQKLMEATLELESLKKEKTELFNLLKIAYQEREEAKAQLQKFRNKLVPSSPTHLQNGFSEIRPESLLMLPAPKANSSISESNSLSHGSSHVDSFFDAVSSPEFSNINNVVDSNNLGHHLNQRLVQVQDFSSPALVYSEKSTSDPATAIIDILAKEKALPQKGKLLQAVIDAGPLLQTMLLAGPLPTWRNPPPLQNIKVPPFTDYELNSFANDGNSFQNPMIPSSHSSNALPTCSASMLNFTLNDASVRIQVPSRKRQRRQLS